MNGFKLEAVFVDRDGVLNKYVRGDYIRNPDELYLLPGAAEAVKLLNDAKLPVFVISNQQGVGKRIMTQDALDQVDGQLQVLLKEQAGAQLTRTYYCVHLAEDKCECRKPNPGMILQAAEAYSLNLSNCVMIGDSLTDMESANGAKIGKTVLVMTGICEMIDYNELKPLSRPTYIARDLHAAVKRLLEDFGG